MEDSAESFSDAGDRSPVECPSPPPASDVSDLSALRENIARKSHNSYYYAHSRVIDGPQWDGNEEPRLLQRMPSTQAGDKEGGADVARPLAPITNYSWGDDNEKVKIYVPTGTPAEGVEPVTISEEDVKLDWDSGSLSLTMFILEGDSGRKVGQKLNIPELHSNITAASLRRRPGKVIITLVKENGEESWHTLRKKV